MPSSPPPRVARAVTFTAADGVVLHGDHWEADSDGAISLVLVHDRGADRSVWERYVSLFLSRGWSVLTFDLRGHDESLRRAERGDLHDEASTDPLDAGWALDLQAALAFAADRPGADPARRVVLGLGLGGDLAYAAAARGWGAASTVCVSPTDARARALAGPGVFAPRAVYLIYGAHDRTGADTALAFAACALYPSESIAYEGTGLAGLALWTERQPEIAARSIAWIERTI